MKAKDWYDVADLLEQGAAGCEIGYEEHTLAARQKATRWMRKLSMQAHNNACNRERTEQVKS